VKTRSAFSDLLHLLLLQARHNLGERRKGEGEGRNGERTKGGSKKGRKK